MRLMLLDVLYADENFVAINKPSGLLVHRTQLDTQATEFALQILRDQLGRPVFPCHRLDRPTSGVLLFALNTDSLRDAQQQFEQRRVAKTYHALVRGWPPEHGHIDYELALEEKPSVIQSAQTEYRCLERYQYAQPIGPYPGARFALLELKPATGRKHQLRRHLAHIRHPILGDTRHGDGKQNQYIRQHFGCNRLLLHASTLSLSLVVDATAPTQIEAPQDPSFSTVVAALRNA
ncbi:MAG: tRNA pseudouridine65 synthase [Lentimonas sp.]|jgi:tRNA pseudouridine65 synthase